MKKFTIKDKEVLVDDEDFNKVISVSWYLDSANYVRHKCRKWHGLLHRFVLNYNGPLIVDHIDHNPLNNQKANLRLVTQVENQKNRKGNQTNNSTGVNGTCLTASGWQAYVNVMGKRIHLGYYRTLETASLARKLFDEGKVDVLSGRLYIKGTHYRDRAIVE